MKLRRQITIKDFFENPLQLVIHCNTQEKAKKLLKEFDKFGYKWKTGYSYLKYNCWDMYTEDTCYDNENEFSKIDWYLDNNYFLLDFDDIIIEDLLTQDEKDYIKSSIKILLKYLNYEDYTPVSIKKECYEGTYNLCCYIKDKKNVKTSISISAFFGEERYRVFENLEPNKEYTLEDLDITLD